MRQHHHHPNTLNLNIAIYAAISTSSLPTTLPTLVNFSPPQLLHLKGSHQQEVIQFQSKNANKRQSYFRAKLPTRSDPILEQNCQQKAIQLHLQIASALLALRILKLKDIWFTTLHGGNSFRLLINKFRYYVCNFVLTI